MSDTKAGNARRRELDEDTAMKRTANLVNVEDAYARLCDGLANFDPPAERTFRHWLTPTYRLRNPEMAAILPTPHRIKGSRRVWLDVDDVERLAKELIAGTGAPVREPRAARKAA